MSAPKEPATKPDAGPNVERRDLPATRGYQEEMLQQSLKQNIIIALDTGSGKTLIAVLRIKHEVERQSSKVAWFFAPTVALCEQQREVLLTYLPVKVGLISGASAPEQWKNRALWTQVLAQNRVIVSTPQVFLDALRHGYINMARDISLMVFDEAHHAVSKHPYRLIMQEFYFNLPLPSGPDDNSRPMVLGLTASPIYGGDVAKSFKNLEASLDAVIRAPLVYRAELAQHVHRPVFHAVEYDGIDPFNPPFSTNLATLQTTINSLDIEQDPYIIDLRKTLTQSTPQHPNWKRNSDKLAKALTKKDTYTLRGLNDFVRAAEHICATLGGWAADWFVYTVREYALRAANPYDNLLTTWKDAEKSHLQKILQDITLSPVSYYPEDIESDCSHKVQVLIECLLNQKMDVDELNEQYSAIVFVERRDAVFALSHLLQHHPATKDVFSIGTLVGSADSAFRQSIMDATRLFMNGKQSDTLADFKIGEKNLIISTAVAEEGIDIQSCGSVIRWDLPPNMASWAQSRGRARKERSTFTLLFERFGGTDALARGTDHPTIQKWMLLEKEMVQKYNERAERDVPKQIEEPADDFREDAKYTFTVPSTGAQLTLQSAVSHLNHFCAVIPNSSHADNLPYYEISPPDHPDDWFLTDPTRVPPSLPYEGPFSATVTLPRSLPIPNRQYTVSNRPSKVSAQRHAAFKAYMALYDAGLLNDHLLPITSVLEPELEEDVISMLADVEKRDSLAEVSMNFNPWSPPTGTSPTDANKWFCSQIVIDGLPPLFFFTRSEPIALGPGSGGPILYRKGQAPIHVSLQPLNTTINEDDDRIRKAREFTRTTFWSLYHSKMGWNAQDYAYLFLPLEPSTVAGDWDDRRAWLNKRMDDESSRSASPMIVNAKAFGEAYGYPSDITLVKRYSTSGRPLLFKAWRYEPLNDEELASLSTQYNKPLEYLLANISYPILQVERFPSKINLTIPPSTSDSDILTDHRDAYIMHLLPQLSDIVLASPLETEYGAVLPSIIRSFSMAFTAHSFRRTIFASRPAKGSTTPSALSQIPIPVLTTALTAPVSGETENYQRLETLGDTVLKLMVGIQVLAEYPLWHEGYLTKKKDHAVSNVRLAKENIKNEIFRWIIRTPMLSKKWRPDFAKHSSATSNQSTPMNCSPDAQISPLPSNNVPEDAKHDRPCIPKKRKSETFDHPAPQPDAKMDADPVPVPPSPSPAVAKKAQGAKAKVVRSKKPTKQKEELSTKVLADVIESTIGAAYLHGNFDLAYECVKLYDLGLKWQPLPSRFDQLLARVPTRLDNVPSILQDVESMLGYTFTRKLLLIEALTHASYQQNSQTPSYERMEFLGDSVLDMIVNDFLYHAPGKNYSPGHIHLRKSAVVNGHILAFIALRTRIERKSQMPRRTVDGRIELEDDNQDVYLWRCLLHSSPKVLADQENTNARFRKRRDEIEEALTTGTFFPWAALTRLQAPKFMSDMVESIIGAIFLDSRGDMSNVRKVLDTLGIMNLLKRIVADDVDVLHPVSRLSLWAQSQYKTIDYKWEKEKGKISCTILVDGEETVKVEEKYRGTASQEEVKFAAAEKAIKEFALRKGEMDMFGKKKIKGVSGFA